VLKSQNTSNHLLSGWQKHNDILIEDDDAADDDYDDGNDDHRHRYAGNADDKS
jgi:hypothetical protein